MESQRLNPAPLVNEIGNNNSFFLLNDNNNHINLMPNNNININFNENQTKLGIPYKELIKIKKEYLIELIQFITYVCNLNIQNKYIDCLFSIFKIIKNKKRNIYQIVINKKEAKYYDYKNELSEEEDNEQFEEGEEEEDEREEEEDIQEEENTFFCEKHSTLFNNLESYYNHCKDNKEQLICQECLKGFWGIDRYKFHKCKPIKCNIDKKNNKLREEKDFDDDNSEPIECTECELTFDSIESMSLHYFKVHEKKKEKIMKERKEKRKRKEEEIMRKNKKNKEIDERLALRMQKIIELDKEKKNKINIKNEVKNEKIKINEVKNESKIERDKKRDEVLEKQQNMIKDLLFKRKEDKINQRVIEKIEENERRKELRRNIILKGEQKEVNKKKKKLTKEELEELEEIKREMETEYREERGIKTIKKIR